MDKETLTGKVFGREVHEGDYISSSEGDIVCKCCAFDCIEEGYFYLLRVVRHMRDVLGAASSSMLAMKNALENMPEEVIYQLMQLNDANDTEAEA